MIKENIYKLLITTGNEMSSKIDLKKFLGDMELEEFLANYWEKKPLLVRGAIKNAQEMISPETRVEMALDPEIESRLVLEKDGKHPWEIIHGEIKEELIEKHKDHCWTLINHGVNNYIKDFHELEKMTSFIPNWHFDDVMITYSKKGGNVAPHIDSYNVFIIQGHGVKKWQINEDPDTEIYPEMEVKVLKNFVSKQEWDLNPGDMLYLPPHVAHYGVALTDGMSYSIGFNSINHQELLGNYLYNVIDEYNEDKIHHYYRNEKTEAPFMLDQDTTNNLHQIIKDATGKSSHFQKWFGRHITRPRYFPEGNDPINFEEFLDEVKENRSLFKDTYLKIFYSFIEGNYHVFINQKDYEISSESAAFEIVDLLNKFPMDNIDASNSLSDEILKIFYELYQQGDLFFTE